jgi:hypothetical protein
LDLEATHVLVLAGNVSFLEMIRSKPLFPSFVNACGSREEPVQVELEIFNIKTTNFTLKKILKTTGARSLSLP